VIVWRVATETRAFAADDISGRGAALAPGRWNRRDEPVVYAAATVALAVLETAAHLDAAAFPLNRFLVEIKVPPAVWALREQAPESELDVAWSAIPAGTASTGFGSRWLRRGTSPILVVPSVIVPEDRVVLINPAHALSASIKARIVRRLEYDLLFRSCR
jgi:RES domain-containing protein